MSMPGIYLTKPPLAWTERSFRLYPNLSRAQKPLNKACNEPCERYLHPSFGTGICMAKICELTGKGSIKGSHIWRSGKAKKKGGIGTHITAITKRRFMPNLQRVKALINGEVRYIRVSAKALKQGLVVKAPKRTWKKEAAAAK
jgi:large subunit ribosomal protein L28